MSVSVMALLPVLRFLPMGFRRSMRSVRRFFATAPERTGSYWNTVRQLWILFRTPPFSVLSSMAFTSSTLRGGGAASMVSVTACRSSGGKVCHSPLKVPHFLSVAGNQGSPFPYVGEQQHIQQIFHMGLFLQGFHEKRVPFFLRRLGGIVPLPAAQQIVIVGQYPETVALHAPELLLRAFLPGLPLRAAPAWWLPVLIRDGEILRQHEGGFLGADVFQTGNKVNHIPVCLTAEAMEAPVNLHAGVFIVMEGADAHPVSSYPDTVMLGGLPGGNRLLHGFKYVQ